jgi:hypothetical protein
MSAGSTPVIENSEPNFRKGSIPNSEAIAGSAESSSNTGHTIEPGPIGKFGWKTVVDRPPFEGSNDGSLAPGASAR